MASESVPTDRAPEGVTVEEVSFTAEDGWRLKGTLFYSQPTSVHGPQKLQGVLISSATGVARSFYSRFAKFVSQGTGWPVLTCDYRGNYGILPEDKRKELPKHPLVDIDAHMADWAMLGQPAALEYLLAYLREMLTEEECAVPGALLTPEVVIVGHSVGGHIIPVLPPHLSACVSRVLFTSVNSAYVKHHRGKTPSATLAALKLAMPVLIAIHGYAPTQKLGLVFGELPSATMEQWLRWASDPAYCFSEPGWREKGEAWPGHVLGISFDDDEIALPSAFPAFTDLLKSAHVTNIHLKPSDVGLEGKIGHTGFFHSRAKEALWRPVLEYIVDGRVPATLLRAAAVPQQSARL